MVPLTIRLQHFLFYNWLHRLLGRLASGSACLKLVQMLWHRQGWLDRRFLKRERERRRRVCALMAGVFLQMDSGGEKSDSIRSMSLSLHLHHTRSSSYRNRWESTHSFSMQMLKVDPLTYKTSKVGFHLAIYISSVVLQIRFTLLALLCVYCSCFCILSWHSSMTQKWNSVIIYSPKTIWLTFFCKLCEKQNTDTFLEVSLSHQTVLLPTFF